MRKRIVVITASTVLAFSVAGCGFGYTKESAASVGGPATESASETVAEAIGTELSEDYDIYRDTYTLEHAGSCIRIDASAEKGGKSMPEHLQKAYIIPAGIGCIVAREYCYITDAEGFGRRIDYMMNTLSVIRID